MPALFIYLIKVNVALLIFCAGYYAVLRHLTFYNLNRIYLVTAIIFSTLYPKVNLSDFLNRHEAIAKPIQVVIVNWQEPVKNITKTFLGHDIWFWLLAAFWTGVTVFAIRLVMQLFSLYRLHKRSEPAKLHHYVIRVIRGNINPFSFWQSIYVNPDNHAPHELDAILEHEHIHVSEWHTLDILLGEISAIFYWFNPGVWLMKRAIRENIEFITDNKILQKGVDCKAYQYSLLNVNFGAQGGTIVNNFNISTIKKRIIMMNAKRSSNVNITRYLFLIPAVMMLLLVFSVSKAELNKAVKTTSAHMIRTFKTVITKIDLLPGNDTPPATNREPSPILSAVSTIHFDSDTIPVKVTERTFIADTGRKITLRLRGMAGNDQQPDIYVDGVKMAPDALGTINPDNISNIDVFKNSAGTPNGVIRIVTKGHEDKDPNVKGHFLINGRLLIDTTPVNNLKGRVNGINLSKPVEGLMIDGKPNEEIIVTGYPTRITKVRLNGKDVPASDLHKVIVNGDSIQTLMIAKSTPHMVGGVGRVYNLNRAEGKKLDSVTVRAINKPLQITTLSTFSLAGSTTAPVKIDKLSDKLIILNGKEITQKQFKKVSAADIESVSVLNAEDAAAKYGDKGKKGVLLITTKK